MRIIHLGKPENLDFAFLCIWYFQAGQIAFNKIKRLVWDGYIEKIVDNEDFIKLKLSLKESLDY